ncbi:unnamed protein product [Mesocestoides corti]|uniref:Uncharacterized protein n=1 Tax=Mesocestoides corti TaxID=53468 RepID=A0A0R3U349_MESCO|nr:unnamed protein product [Mesocestoides corti]
MLQFQGAIVGFIQFRSPIFKMDDSLNILVKVTSVLNCLCTEPIGHLLIAWPASAPEKTAAHREAFVAELDRRMHQRVRIGGLTKATLYPGQQREGKIWRYVPGKSSIRVSNDDASIVCGGHRQVCPNWPPHLVPRVDLVVKRSCRHYTTVTRVGGGGDDETELILHVPELQPGSVVRAFGLWHFEGRFLEPSILTSWGGACQYAVPVDGHTSGLECSPVADNALNLALLTLFTKSEAAGSNDTEAALLAEGAIEALRGCLNKTAPVPRTVDLASQFIHLREHARPAHFTLRILTTADLVDAETPAWLEADNRVNLSDRPLQLFKSPSTSPVILIGRLGRQPGTGVLTVGPVFPQPSSVSIPLVLIDNPTLTRPMFNDLVLIPRPRLLVNDAFETPQVAFAFGRSLPTIPRRLIICDSVPRRISPTATGVNPARPNLLAEDSQSMVVVEDEAEPAILLRFVSPLSPELDSFSVKYESSLAQSHSLSTKELRCEEALWAYSSGVFNVGTRLHLRGGAPEVVEEPSGLPLSSSCHHLVGIYQWRVLSVCELLIGRLLWPIDWVSAIRRFLGANKASSLFAWLFVLLQGYIVKQKIHPPSNGKQRASIWLIDRYSLDTTASAPLRIDFFSSEKAEDLARLPTLTHVGLFKVRVVSNGDAYRLVVPLSPNRFQISPNGLCSYFHPHCRRLATADSSATIGPLPVCRICQARQQTKIQPEAGLAATLDLLCDEKPVKVCFVHIVKCLEFNVAPTPKYVRILLKLLVSDGSANAIASFNSDLMDANQTTMLTAASESHMPSMASTSCQLQISPACLRCVSSLLGLGESITSQLITHLAIASGAPADEGGDPVRIGLRSWLSSPGFLRSVFLTLAVDPSASYSRPCWRLRTAAIGSEIRLTASPLLKLRIIH